MSKFSENYVDPERIRNYTEKGPPAFAPGHSGMLQMTGVLLSERVPEDGHVLVVGAGGGLETRYLAGMEPQWRFVGVDPADGMLELARAVAGPVAGERMHLIKGTVLDAPEGPFDAATCILVLGILADDGGKLELLAQIRRRLKTGAPMVLVDQCINRAAPDFHVRLDRYAEYARRSGVEADIVQGARTALESSMTMVSASRNEALLSEAGFCDIDVFYVGMAWRGWIAYA